MRSSSSPAMEGAPRLETTTTSAGWWKEVVTDPLHDGKFAFIDARG